MGGSKELLGRKLIYTSGEKIRLAPDRMDNDVTQVYVGEELYLIDMTIEDISVEYFPTLIISS